MKRLSWGLAGALALATAAAHAADPKFDYGKKEDVKGVIWKAEAQAGLVLTTGNSRTTTFSAGATASRKAGDNKLTLDLAAAYTRTEIRLAVDLNNDMMISADEIDTQSQTTTDMWLAKLRYDRFLTDRNSLYATARVEANEPAGKELLGGGQLGYSRLIFKSAVHELATELGYDVTYENYVAPGDAIWIHSARGFAGYSVTLSSTTSGTVSTEILANVNSEDTPTGEVDPFGDIRLTSKLTFSTKLRSNISVRFGFTMRYDQAPAPLPPFALPYAAGFVPIADEFDTTTELTLVISLL